MDIISGAIEEVKARLPDIEVRLNEPMKNHTSFRIGASVRAMYFPKSVQELERLCIVLCECMTAPLVIGNGTNLLVDDSKTLEMVAIKTGGISYIEQTGETEITAGAGISLSKLAEFACERGLSGLEYAHGIPGSLGGAVSMNAGAYGGQMKDVVYRTNAFSPMTGICEITGVQHGFGYRKSKFSGTNDIIVSSTVRLKKGNPKKISEKTEELNSRRRESQPLEMPSAGSTFKRPKDGYAATLIEQAGLKGFTIGGAKVSEKHSGFIINFDAATFADVISLIDHVRETVLKQFGIELEPEIKIIKAVL